MPTLPKNARILVVTPEITRVPQGMQPASRFISARAGGLGDVCAALVDALYVRGYDVHLAIPNYRDMYINNARRKQGIDVVRRWRELPENRIHLAQDRSFFYHPKLLLNTNWDNIHMALAFQREVINRIIAEVKPDLIHCYDWMTGLIPAMAALHGIACLFTVYRPDSARLLLSTIEERGIDAASFWQNCYYSRMPINYEETRSTNPLDLLASGVFAARAATALSETFMKTLTDGVNTHATPWLSIALRKKFKAGQLIAAGPAPDPSFNPACDRALKRPYGPESHIPGKLFNKFQLQETLKLKLDATAPVCFWPTRLDFARPGCRMMVDNLATILARYREQRLQIVFVADGDLQAYLRDQIGRLHAHDRAAVCDFNEQRYRLAYAGADFLLMPHRLDSCALPSIIGQCYGTLSIAFDAGAIHDCVEHLNADAGSGFLFKYYDAEGFLWAIDQAMTFYSLPRPFRKAQVQRIMTDSLIRFAPESRVQQTIDIYAHTLDQQRACLKTASMH